MKHVVVNRRRSAFFAIGIALLLILTPLYIGYTILSNARSSAAGATACTWTGGGSDTNWSTAANWTCDEGTVPEDGTALTFPYGLADQQMTTINNDLVGTNVYTGITFSGTCIGDPNYYNFYEITGNALLIAGDVIAEQPGNTADIAQCRPALTDVTFQANGVFERARIAGTAALGTNDVTFEYVNINDLTGSGDILAHDHVWLEGDTSGFTGTLTVTNGMLWGYSFGASTVPITIGTGGYLGHGQFSTTTYPNSITVQSGAAVPTIIFAPQAGDLTSIDENYDKFCTSDGTCGANINQLMTFSGTITLAQDLSVEAQVGGTQFTGTINGNGHGITLYNPSAPNDGSTGNLVINSGSNNSTSANGTYNPTVYTSTLSDSTSATILAGWTNKVVVNGARGNVTIQGDGILSGSGTVGDVSFQPSSTGRIQPGNSPEVLTTGSVNFVSTGNLDIELGGTATGEYDQLNVTGSVTLAGATLNVSHWNGYVPINGDSFTIINNDASDAVSGTFAGLAEGAQITVGEVIYTISYVGGTGNDVVLTTFDSPGPPNTAGILGQPTSLLLPLGIFLVSIAALLLRYQFKRLRTVAIPAQKK